MLIGSFPREPVCTILATVGIVFAALYMLWIFQRTMQGPVRGAAVARRAGARGRLTGPAAGASGRRRAPAGPAR